MQEKLNAKNGVPDSLNNVVVQIIVLNNIRQNAKKRNVFKTNTKNLECCKLPIAVVAKRTASLAALSASKT